MDDTKRPGAGETKPAGQPEPPPFEPDEDLITEFEKGLRDGKPSKS